MKKLKGSISVEAVLCFTVFMILCLMLTGTLLSVYLNELLSWDIMNTRESMSVITQPFMGHETTVQSTLNGLVMKQIAISEVNRQMVKSETTPFIRIGDESSLRFNAFGIADLKVSVHYTVPSLIKSSEIIVPINALIAYDGINFNVPIVYITNYGEKFHKGDCFHLRKSKYAIPIEEAEERGYEACKNCHTDSPSKK